MHKTTNTQLLLIYRILPSSSQMFDHYYSNNCTIDLIFFVTIIKNVIIILFSYTCCYRCKYYMEFECKSQIRGIKSNCILALLKNYVFSYTRCVLLG